MPLTISPRRTWNTSFQPCSLSGTGFAPVYRIGDGDGGARGAEARHVVHRTLQHLELGQTFVPGALSTTKIELPRAGRRTYLPGLPFRTTC
ncbi:hypothetical protein ACIQ7D_06160 [Streptomyces sp. NPDC096310]|uniref:hypothetical protein n=1 Tax=Streptomyces sp. NPDC096310 TaxID=3366082 RepID=UPI003804FB35